MSPRFDLMNKRCSVTSASAYNLLPYAVLIEACEENPSRHIVKKGNNITIAFQDDFRKLSLILYQNLSSARLFKSSDNMKSDS